MASSSEQTNINIVAPSDQPNSDASAPASEAVPAAVQVLAGTPHPGAPMATGRLYKLWPGRNSWGCFGCLQFGPSADFCCLISGWLSLLVAGFAYFACVAPWMWTNISVAWPIIGAVLWLSTAFFYARAAFMDPGFVPRKRIATAIAKAAPEWWQTQTQQLAFARATSSIYTDRALPPEQTKLCTTCDIERPFLASHCSQCDNCVEVADHHCNWIANCVGQRNHRAFVAFVVDVFVLAWYFLACSIVYLVRKDNLGSSLADIGAVVLLVGMVIAGCVLTAAAGQHLELVSSGETFKMRDHGHVKTFTDRCCETRLANVFRFFFTYSPRPSLVPTNLVISA